MKDNQRDARTHDATLTATTAEVAPRGRKQESLRVSTGLRAGCVHTGTSEHCGRASCDG